MRQIPGSISETVRRLIQARNERWLTTHALGESRRHARIAIGAPLDHQRRKQRVHEKRRRWTRRVAQWIPTKISQPRAAKLERHPSSKKILNSAGGVVLHSLSPMQRSSSKRAAGDDY